LPNKPLPMKYLYTLLILSIFVIHSQAQTVSLTSIGSAYEQNFNTLASTGSSSTLPTGWLILESGTSTLNNGAYNTGTGSSNAGDTYSFGSSGSSDRSLGGLRSGTLVPLIGASFTNNTGTTISALTVQYQGEQWRLGTINRGSDRLDFQISYNATALNNGTWTDINALDFIGPVNTGTVGQVVGNNNAVTIAFEISALNIADGQSFFIRWVDADVTNADDGLSVDNFSITPQGILTPDPSISFSPAALALGEVNVGQSKTVSYEVVPSNLTNNVQISVNNSEYELSTDNTTFAANTTLPATGGIIYVRFTPAANGSSTASIEHTSAAYSKALSVTGSGYEPTQNIISIASARNKSVGTKVTVAGRITVANELGNPAYVQDDTGGIPVFESTLANGVQIGDSVIVTGPIGVFNDQKQISGSGIIFTKVATAPRIISPKIISVAELAANEGLLVTIPTAEVVNKSFVFYPQSTEQINDGTATADLRIDGDTDIPGLTKPQGTFDITGVVGRFRTNAQLLPRFEEDVPGAAEPGTATDTIPKTETLDVVNWNFEFFGARSEDYGNEEFGPADEALQLENIKTVLLSLNADIIAAEEISDEALLATLVGQLPNHDYLCSQRFSRSWEGPSSDFPPQKVCLIYNTETVEVLSARAMFEEMYDEARLGNTSVLPNYPTGDPSSFYSSGRLPFLVNVRTRINGVAENVSLIVIHAKSGSTVSDWNRRVYDAQVLKDTLDTSFADKNVIFLGDLNDDLDQSIVSGKVSSYVNFVNDENYLPVTKVLSEAGARSTVSFQDVIDHQILSNELQEEFLEGSQMIVTPFRLIENYAATTSDHLPVITRFRLQAPVVGFDSVYVSVIEGDTTITIPLHISKAFAENTTLTVNVAGTASYSSDYETSPSVAGGVLSINLLEGETGATISMDIHDDIVDELTEWVSMTIASGAGYQIDNAQFDLTLIDNDVPTIGFEVSHVEVAEGESVEVKLVLSTPVISDQEVTINVTNGFKAIYELDYTSSPSVVENQITVPITAGEESVAFTIHALEDKPREKDETISLEISAGEGLEPVQSNSIVVLKNTRFRPSVAVSPNPTTDIITINSADLGSDEIIRVELITAYGERGLSVQGTLEQVNARLASSMRGIRKGILILNIYYGDETYSERIVKK
jgi:hypothetical protein